MATILTNPPRGRPDAVKPRLPRSPRRAAREAVAQALAKLQIGRAKVYRAAYPGYPGNFTRDGILAALLGSDMDALSAQVDYTARHMGRKFNPFTGEEPGKAHHELPGVVYRGASTAYNACDTSALYLLGVCALVKNGRQRVLARHQRAIDSAVGYISSHVIDNLFTEFPPAGAERYALRVTYWKDSVLNSSRIEPVYPIVYSVAHFVNASALLSLGEIKADGALITTARAMYEAAFSKLWASDHFVAAVDGDGRVIDAPSTDSLFSLNYIPPALLPAGWARKVENYSDRLATDAGYRAGLARQTIDGYHTSFVWVFEQAIIHMGAKLHGLCHTPAVACRVLDHIKPDQMEFPELLNPGKPFKPANSNIQLCTVRAYQYFIKQADTQARAKPIVVPGGEVAAARFDRRRRQINYRLYQPTVPRAGLFTL